MRVENEYYSVYYSQCDDVGENDGGFFIQFYADPNFDLEIDNMVLHKNTDEVINPEKYIHEYIECNNLEYIVARESLKYGIKDNPKLIKIVDMFMNEEDEKALKELYKVTEDKLVKILLDWRQEYEGFIDDYMTYVGSMYENIMDYVWERYKLNEITNNNELTEENEDEYEI